MNKSHCCIFGATSSGKTYLAGHLFQSLPNYNIFFNVQYEPAISRDFNGFECCGLDEFCEMMEAGARRIVYNPESEDPAGQAEECKEIIDILFSMGKIINQAGRRFVWCHLYIDEVHILSSKKSPYPPIDRIATQGKRFGVAGIFISQRPALVSQTLITQSDRQMIFRCNSYEIPYFERYGYPISDFQSWLNKPYHYILDTGIEIKKMNPIKV